MVSLLAVFPLSRREALHDETNTAAWETSVTSNEK